MLNLNNDMERRVWAAAFSAALVEEGPEALPSTDCERSADTAVLKLREFYTPSDLELRSRRIGDSLEERRYSMVEALGMAATIAYEVGGGFGDFVKSSGARVVREAILKRMRDLFPKEAKAEIERRNL